MTVLLPPNSCPAGWQYYTCEASQYTGCCSVDACDYVDGCPDDSGLPSASSSFTLSSSIPFLTTTGTSAWSTIKATPPFISFTSAASSSSIAFSPSFASSTPTASSSSIGTATSTATSSAVVPSSSTSVPSSAISTLAVASHTGSTLSARAIGGIVVGGAVTIVLFALLAYWFWRNAQNKKRNAVSALEKLEDSRPTSAGTGMLKRPSFVISPKGAKISYNSVSDAVSPLRLDSVVPTSWAVSPIITAPDPEPDPVPQLDSTPISPQSELYGSPVDPLGIIPEISGQSSTSGRFELPSDAVALSSRGASEIITKVTRSDPTKPHAASWRQYEEFPESELMAQRTSVHLSSRLNRPFTGPNFAHWNQVPDTPIGSTNGESFETPGVESACHNSEAVRTEEAHSIEENTNTRGVAADHSAL